ncbi:superoxide dismutase [Mn] [Ixodes scapularis]|uniref:superoxide dismutase [Mn] n=1 Tax=Ixodes scapularis TaxID=6945 RepID=UPI0011619604|nr:superoxide dismutase [Mn] [Ixodes scapularis]
MVFSILALIIVLQPAWSGIAPPYHGLDRPSLEYELPPLPYVFDALEPYIDEETLRIHYFGHHAKYTREMNRAFREWRKYLKDKHASRLSLIDILRNFTRVPAKYRSTLIHNVEGYVNHVLYWSVMSPNPGKEVRAPDGALAEEIDEKFGSFKNFMFVFSEQAASLLGCGYVWLCRNTSSPRDHTELTIVTTSNEESPISRRLHPMLVLDLWEHSYFLKHHHSQREHVVDWWHLVDWHLVDQLDRWWRHSGVHDEL